MLNLPFIKKELPLNKMATEDVLNFPVTCGNTEQFVESIFSNLEQGKCKWLACINSHSYAVTTKNEIFTQALKNADWLTPDGIGIVWASHILGGNVPERVTGDDVFQGVNSRLNDIGGSVFFLGSSEEHLAEIAIKIKQDYPNIKLAGTYSPPFKQEFSEDDNNKMVAAINECKPDVLWVGLTSPKQDIWLYQNSDKLNVKFAAGVGAVFDFYTGRIKRSPIAIQKLGMEWVWRFLSQPRRLAHRFFGSNAIFIWAIIRWRWKLRHAKNKTLEK